MHTLSKIIPFPISSRRAGQFSSAAYPRFAVAFGDRDRVPLNGIAQPEIALVLPDVSPCH